MAAWGFFLGCFLGWVHLQLFFFLVWPVGGFGVPSSAQVWSWVCRHSGWSAALDPQWSAGGELAALDPWWGVGGEHAALDPGHLVGGWVG